MRTSTKLGLLGIATTIVIQVIFEIWHIRDYRKGNRRINKKDIDLIAKSILSEQEALKLAKKNASKTISKES